MPRNTVGPMSSGGEKPLQEFGYIPQCPCPGFANLERDFKSTAIVNSIGFRQFERLIGIELALNVFVLRAHRVFVVGNGLF